MSKKRPERTGPSPAPPAPAIGPLAPILLLAISAAESLLALFQWMELLVVRAGGSAVCGLTDAVNCQRVWESRFATRVHDLLGVPVAGLGVVWGLAAFGLSLSLTWQLLNRRHGRAHATALQGMAVLGVGAIVVFAIASWQAAAVCLTCVVTYAVVAAFALVAFRMLPRDWPSWARARPAGLWFGAFLVGAYLLALGPGRATPRAGQSGAATLSGLPSAKPGPPVAPADNATSAASGVSSVPVTPVRPLSESEAAVVTFLSRLSSPDRQAVSNALAIFRTNPALAGTSPAPRRLLGPKEAPVKIVDWVEIRCGHCRQLNETLHELTRVVPDGSMSIEARNFPLANECNPRVPRKDPSGVSCTAAKAMICLEPTKDFWKVREALFEEQQTLTRERVLEIASSGEMDRRQLEVCVASAETARRLQEDIEYAWRFEPDGTPLVVVNGRKATQSGPFLYAMALTRGDAKSPAFDRLPPPTLGIERAGPTP